MLKNQVLYLFLKVFAVGYIGSILIGLLSDSIIPFWGETVFGLHPQHVHVGLLEKWWLINTIVIAAIVFAYYKPTTKISHAGHVLISTWASMFHVLMASTSGQAIQYAGIFVFLFIAVWIPCCFSDIVFPLLFVKRKKQFNCSEYAPDIFCLSY